MKTKQDCPTPWREFNIESNKLHYWKIGPLKLWAYFKKGEEVNFYTLHSNSLEDRDIECILPYDGEIEPEAQLSRFAYSGEIKNISFHPLLPKRDIIFRPDKPIHLPAKKEMQLYVNTSLLLSIKVNNKEVLTTFPIFKLSETWIGPDPTNGELHFAAKTRGVLDIEQIIYRPFRFVSKFIIKNETHESVPIERIRMLSDYLNLYKTEDEIYYSDHIVVKIDEDLDVKITTKKPSEKDYGHLHKVLPARILSKNLVMRALATMIQ